MTKAITNLVTIFLLAIIGSGLSAQDFSIEGELYKPNGDRIAGAEVLMVAGDQMATEITNDQGFYQHTFNGLADSTMIEISTENVCSGEMLEEVIFYFPNGNVSVDFLMCNNNPSDSCMAMFAWNQMDGNNIQFEDISMGNPTARVWYFGDGASSTEQSPLHQYQQAGEYMVTLEIEGEDCSSATEMYVFVGDSIWPPNDSCLAMFEWYQTDAMNVQFMDYSMGNPTAWVWYFGDGVSSTEQSPLHQYQQAGEYMVTLEIEGEDCSSATEMYVFVGDSIWPPNDSCLAMFEWYQTDAMNVQFMDYSMGNPTAWVWYFGDGASSTEQSPLHQYQQAGEYMVTLEIEGEDCSSATEMYVFVGDSIWPPNDSCLAMFEWYQTDAMNVQFMDYSMGNPTAWVWYFGDGVSSTEQSPLHQYQEAGEYMVTLEIQGEDCFNATEMYVFVGDSIWPPAGCEAYYTYEALSETSVQFYDLSEGDGIEYYSWDFGDGATSDEQNPQHEYAASGIYPVFLTISGDSCQSVYGMDIIVGDSIWPPNDSCMAMFAYYQDEESMQVYFEDLSMGNPTEWAWDFGDGNTSSEQNPVHDYQEEGIYVVHLIAGNDDCSSEIYMDIFVGDYWWPQDCQAMFYPYIDSTNDLTVHFINESFGGDAYLWEFGDGDTSTEENPVHTYAQEGEYIITLTISSDSCESSFSMAMMLNSDWMQGDYQALFYPELLHANTFIFHDMSIPADQISGWSWDFGDGNTSTEQNPEHSYAAAGNYVVNLEVSVTGERNSSLYAIELNSETGEFTAMMNMSTTSVAEKQGPLNTAIYPNPVKGLLSYSFSSNGDATAEVRILNIAGQLIQAEQINVASGNNQGRIDVNSLNNGVYLLEIRYDDGNSETIRFIK